MKYDEAKALVKNTNVTKDHWETIQQWRIDEGKNFARSRSNQISRMAAGGMKAGSQQWEDNLQRIDAANRKELKRQGGSATQGILDRWTDTMKDFYIDASKTRSTTRQTKGDDRTSTLPTNEGVALQKYGKGKNPYTDSGMSEADFRNLSTEDFMVASFGHTSKYSKHADLSGDRSRTAAAEGERQKAARSQTQRASPWWA